MNILEDSCLCMAREDNHCPLPAKVWSPHLVSCLRMSVMSKRQLHWIWGHVGKSIPPSEGMLIFLLLEAQNSRDRAEFSNSCFSSMQAPLFFHQKGHKADQLSSFWEVLLLVCCLWRSHCTGCILVLLGAATCHCCPQDSCLHHSTLPHTCKDLPGFSFSLF